MSENVFNHEQGLKQAEAASNVYDINQHANDMLGPVTFTPRELADMDQKMNSGWWAQQKESQAQTGNGNSMVTLPTGNEVKGEINPYRIQSDTPYNILGTTKTKNGTIVHVDEYPTQKLSPEEKEKKSKEFGELTGYGLGAAGGWVGASQGPVGMGIGIYGGYDAGKALGTAAGRSIYKTDPSVPVTQKGDVRYVRVK